MCLYHSIFKFLFTVVLVVLAGTVCIAQKGVRTNYDTTYYQSYRDKLTARVYLSRKYTTLKMSSPNDAISEMKYKPTTTLNLGVGGTYRSLTINIGVGISSFNPDNTKGETHYLDLQAHFYARKWNFDLLGQFYRGFYLTPSGLGTGDSKIYYVRPDLKVGLVGVAAYRAVNERLFSYQAGLVQNEWQKKSAGSLLLGGEVFYGTIHGDSVLVPESIDPDYYNSGTNKVHFFEIGPGIGYAYTLVIDQHFFILASAVANLDFRYARELNPNDHKDRVDFTPNFILRAGAGYNTAKWCISVLWISNYTHVRGGATEYRYLINTGNYRLTYARRFSLDHKVKKALKPINDIIEQN